MPRPTVFTNDVLQKLEHAFSVDSTDEEACFYADISPASLYNYQAKNPKFLERKEALKQNPVLKARLTVVKAIETDPRMAFRYLERKRKGEFGMEQQPISNPERVDVWGNEDAVAAITDFEQQLKELIRRG